MAVAVGGVLVVRLTNHPGFEMHGLPGGGRLNAKTLREGELVVTSAQASALKGTEVSLNGKPVAVRASGGELVIELGSLRDGEYELRVAKAASVLGGGAELSRRFTVDTTPPDLKVADARTHSLKGPVTIKGSAKGASGVTVDGRKARLGSEGAFAITLGRPPARAEVVATDVAGNTAHEEVAVTVRRPLLRAVHVSALGWASDQLRKPILALLREGKLNAVQLDIKDELGEIGYDSRIPLARKTGASKGYYDAKKAIKQIHDAGGTVVGRVVAFRDPILAAASWKDGHRNRVVQTPSGRPYGAGSKYGALSFTNFADKDVRKYHLDLVAEATGLGFDDILYDYIRRPDGKLSGMSFPGLGDSKPEDSIARLVAQTRPLARQHGAFLGVSVFGIAVTRPLEIAQDIGKLAKACDYIAPMIYPSHWNPGEYGVADPNAQPYAITKRSLADFKQQTKGTNAQIIPWIQDFSMGIAYGDKEVAAQIRGAADNGIKSFLLWNPGVRYHGGALARIG
ncbi:putative glycoside hydrolase [Streptomyces sp. KR80]|uniref:putative glycoside hydrolase n=1 Tax=Streptomyces sp. KR80 TaxID=3457426 RepID=UPI003FD4EFDB